MSRKGFLLVLVALAIWALVALRYVRLTRDPLPTAAGPGAPAQSMSTAPLRAAFVLPDTLAYDDPFQALLEEADPGEAESAEMAPPDPFAAPPPGFGAPPPPVTLRGVVGTSALLVMPDGQTMLVREGDLVHAPGYAEASVARVFHDGITLTYAGEAIDLFVQQ